MTLFHVLVVVSGSAFVLYGLRCLGSAEMQREFERFGLAPYRMVIGVLEVLGGVGLLGGFIWAPAWWMASAGLCLLMLAGVIVRVRSGDSVLVTVPAIGFMVVNGYIFYIVSHAAGG